MRNTFKPYPTHAGKFIGKIIILPYIELSGDEITVKIKKKY